MSSSRLLVALVRSERNRLSSSGSSSGAASSSSLLQGWLAFVRSPPSTSSFSSSASLPPVGERRPTEVVYDLVQRSEAPQTTAQLWESAQVRENEWNGEFD